MVPRGEQTIVIGGGPAGASAAVYLARYCLPVLLLDAPRQVTGRTVLATTLENFLGHTERVRGTDFLRRVGRQLERFNVARREERVTRVERAGSGFRVHTDAGSAYAARYVVLAVGLVDVIPDIPGLEPYFEHSVYHCPTCDWFQNRDKRLAIVGDDDASLELATELVVLHQPAAMAVVASGPDARFSPQAVEEAAALGIRTYGSAAVGVEGRNGFLERIRLADGEAVEAEIMLPALGYRRLDQFLDEGGIRPARDAKGFVVVNPRTCESSVSDLFAVGPCNDGPDQAIIAAGEGALAATEIKRRIIAQVL